MNEVSLADVVGGAGTEPGEPGRRSRRDVERRRRRRRHRAWVTVLVALVVLALGFGGAWLGLRPMISSLSQPNDYTGVGTQPVEVTIPDGASGTVIGQVLQSAGVVLTVKGFVSAYNADPRGATIQPGTYTLKQRMSSAAAIDALVGDANRMLDRVTIPEGMRVADLPALVAAHTKIPKAEVQAALANPAAFGLPAQAQGDPEGWLFPATYDVQPHTAATAVLSQMVKRTVDELDSAGVAPAQQRRTLVLASLVQAEARLPADFPKIARVLDNRLARGMKLELDSTVHYATKKFARVGTSLKDIQLASPYNTYQVPGLPIGPIGNPGTVAIQAVLSPPPGRWLYFVTTNPDTGQTEYASTPAEFALIKAKYDAWAKAHPSR